MADRRLATKSAGAVAMNTKKYLIGNPTQGLFGATLGFFVGFAAVSLFGPTAQKFNEMMKLTPVMIGFLVSMPSLSGSLLRIPFAAWVDTTGGRKPFLILLALSVVGMSGLTALVYLLYPQRLTASLYPLLLFLGMLSGCGIATFSVGISQVSYWFPRARQGSALGTYAGVGNLAPGIFTFLLPMALNTLGLAGSYLVWLVILAGGTGLYYLLGRNAWYFQFLAAGTRSDQARQEASRLGQEIFPSGGFKNSLASSARVWKTWALVGIYFTTFGGFIALTAWFPTYWKSYFAMGAVAAGALTGLYSILTSLSRVAGGAVADRLGGESTTMLALFTTLAGAALMTAAHNPLLAVIAALVMAAGMGVGNAAVFKLVPQEVPHAVGGASGWIGGLGAFGGFVFPPVLGAAVRIQGAGGYAAGFSLFIILALGSIGLAYALRRSHTR